SDFPRLRVGIGHPKNSHVQGREHVLSAATGDEGILLITSEERAVEAVQMFLTQGLATTMNIFNTDPEEVARKAEEQAHKKHAYEERLRLKRETDELAQRSAED
ncbi:MAG: aminoacyl-tRNA hydrolase, partial [Ktedonobacteraceae bacterium]